MKQIFLVSLVGPGVVGANSIIGFISSHNREVIANHLDLAYSLVLKDLLPNRFKFQDGYHWEYTTDNYDINVHVDVCGNLEK